MIFFPELLHHAAFIGFGWLAQNLPVHVELTALMATGLMLATQPAPLTSAGPHDTVKLLLIRWLMVCGSSLVWTACMVLLHEHGLN